MNYKKTVLLGMVLSTLLTTLVMFRWIPAAAAAFIILAGGLLATVYLALNQVLVEKLKRLELAFTAQKRLRDQPGMEPLFRELIHWGVLLGPCERAFLFRTEGAEENGIEPGERNWTNITRMIGEKKKILIWPDPDMDIQPPDSGVESFLGAPLYCGEKLWGVLYLINKLDKPQFSRQDADRVQFLIKTAEAALKENHLLVESRAFYHQLLHYIVRGLERPEFKGHADRVTSLAVALGDKLGITDVEAEELYLAAQLHDMGRALPAAEGEREKEESNGDQEHPERGAGLFPRSAPWAVIRDAVLYHHERYDGSGFPAGLLRNKIPLLARIIAVADFFDALTNLAGEDQRLSPVDAYRIMKQATGTLFDPMVIVVLEELLPTLEKQSAPSSQT